MWTTQAIAHYMCIEWSRCTKTVTELSCIRAWIHSATCLDAFCNTVIIVIGVIITSSRNVRRPVAGVHFTTYNIPSIQRTAYIVRRTIYPVYGVHCTTYNIYSVRRTLYRHLRYIPISKTLHWYGFEVWRMTYLRWCRHWFHLSTLRQSLSLSLLQNLAPFSKH